MTPFLEGLKKKQEAVIKKNNLNGTTQSFKFKFTVRSLFVVDERKTAVGGT